LRCVNWSLTAVILHGESRGWLLRRQDQVVCSLAAWHVCGGAGTEDRQRRRAVRLQLFSRHLDEPRHCYSDGADPEQHQEHHLVSHTLPHALEAFPPHLEIRQSNCNLEPV